MSKRPLFSGHVLAGTFNTLYVLSAYLHALTVIFLTPQLVHYVQCLHASGQNTFQSLPSLKAVLHWARWEKARRIPDGRCFHTERETINRLLLIHACTLGGADQQCIFPHVAYVSRIWLLHRPLLNIQHYIKINKVWFYTKNANILQEYPII